MKKIITSAIVILLLFCLSAVASEASSLKVSITDFSYSADTLPAGDNLGVTCKIKQIYSENQEYTFIILVTKDGEYFDHYETSGVLKNNIPDDISGQVAIPSDTSDVAVETFVWDSLKSGKALATMGVFDGNLSSENSLLKLYLDGEELEIKDNMTVTYSSLSHTPNIAPVAKDASAKVEVDEITSIPQDVNIRVTAQNGEVKNYVLSLEIADGKITNAYQLDKNNSKVVMTTGIAELPVFPEGKGPADVDDGYKTVVPNSKTLLFHDRPLVYLVNIPSSLIGKTVVQPSYQLLNYDSVHLDKTKGNAETGFFTIDRSADVYVYGVHDTTDWIVSQGYEKLGAEYKASRTQNSINPASHFAYRKRFVVEEGETKTVTLGGATSMDGVRDSYYIVVDFINPASFVGAKSIYIDGIGNVELKDNVYEYDFVVMDSFDPVIECELLGVGATAEYTVTDNINGQTATVVLKSGDGTNELTYKLNFVNFSEALQEINVDGSLIEGFDNDKKDYTYLLPFGVTEPKEVTASVLSNPDIELNVVQATSENPVATVTLLNKLTGEEIVYTVTFEKSNMVTVKPAISYLGSNSSCSQSNGSAYRFIVSIYDNSITTNFLKIDISQFKNKDYINDNAKFTLNMKAKMQRSPASEDAEPDSMTVKVLALPDTFDWDTEAANRVSSTYVGTGEGSDYKNYVAGKTPVATASLPFTNQFETVSLDISSVINEAIAGNGDYAYIALAGDIAQKAEFGTTKNIVYYYYTTGDNGPTLTLEINE